MSERPVIFTLLMDEPPNGKLPVLSVHSFAVLLESNLRENVPKVQSGIANDQATSSNI